MANSILFLKHATCISYENKLKMLDKDMVNRKEDKCIQQCNVQCILGASFLLPVSVSIVVEPIYPHGAFMSCRSVTLQSVQPEKDRTRSTST